MDSRLPSSNMDIKELLIDIVQSEGGKIGLSSLEEAFERRTGFALSAMKSSRESSITSSNSNQQGTVEYLQSILSDGGPLRFSIPDSHIYLHFETPLNCSTESEMSLSEVIVKLKVSGKITQLDLSRRCFSSQRELLEVCKCAKLLKKLVIRDICFANDTRESANVGISLVKHMKWYCTSLEEIDVTGCSDVTRSILLESQDNALQEHGTPVKRAIDVKIIDSLEEHCIIKELLTPSQFSKHLSVARSMIEEFVNKGGPVNISHDGWTFFHTASAIGDEGLTSWLLNAGENSKFHSEGSRKPSALEIAIYRHDAPIVKLLLDAQKTTAHDPCRFVKMLFRSSDVCKVLRHVVQASAPNPRDVVTFFMKSMSLELKNKLLVEIFKTLETSFRSVKETIPRIEDILAELLKNLMPEDWSPDISIPELNDKTLLMCAVSSPVLVNTLLNIGAKICIKDGEGNTALFYAAREAVHGTGESLEALLRLLPSCEDVNKRNNLGETPLLYTVSTRGFKGHGALLSQFSTGSCVKTWEVLVDAGARIDVKSHQNESIIHLILEHIKYLVRDPQTSQDDNLISLAVDETIGMINFVYGKDKKLLNGRDEVGNTALHNLVSDSSIHHNEIVRIAEVLLKCESLVNVQNNDGQTPLHLVKLWPMAKLLLDHDGGANILDSCGRSPFLSRCLQYATNKESLDMDAWFEDGLNYGLDPWLQDKEGQSVFEVLLQFGKLDDLRSLITSSIFKDKETIFKKDQKGNTLLHILCNYNAAELRQLLSILLQKGADANAINEDGDTPLHIACRKILRLPQPKGDHSAHWKFISPLRAYGADYNIKNKKNCSVLYMVWTNKALLSRIRTTPNQRECEPLFPWNRVSKAHSEKLFQVVRRRNVGNLEDLFYHREPIGSGSFGRVFAAINSNDGREVALKRVERLRLQTRQENREVQSLIQLARCPQVVTYLKFIERTDFTWIVLELMEGHLDDLLSLKLEANRFPYLCKDVLQGVRYLHENKFVHRDLKPTNILFHLDQDVPRLKISDFGLSKNLAAVSSSGSVYHSNAGTRCWMAPELLDSRRPEHTFLSDLFAVGLILHYLLADTRHPFKESDEAFQAGAIEKNIITDNKFLCEDLSEEAKDLVLQLTSAKRDDRLTASDALKHPFFWSDRRKVQFISAVANQKEIATYNPHDSTRPIVGQQIENSLSSLPDWSGLFPTLHSEMTSGRGFRTYETSSAVHLLRFIRNAYAHVSDSRHSTGFQTALLTDYIFFREVPKLIISVYNAVKAEKWHTKDEISNVLQSTP
ncbi:uncharacterized protein [Acropora muricata]|uniref:uncharacterized protein n=1 Tax=Acropora muricata TaxID=159855 RepID=UPI0034E48CA5